VIFTSIITVVFEVVRADIIVDGAKEVGDLIEIASELGGVSSLESFSCNMLIHEDLVSALFVQKGGGERIFSERTNLNIRISPAITNTDTYGAKLIKNFYKKCSFTLEVDVVVGVVLDQDGSKSGDVMSTEAFTENVKVILGETTVQLEESDQEDLEISDSIHSVIRSFSTTDRETNTNGIINEQEVILIIPVDSL